MSVRQDVVGRQEPLPPRRHSRTRAELLADDLAAHVHSHALRAGDPVGTLASVRAETGLAYSTVSEAVRLLRDRGVLEVRPGRGGGLFVADQGPVVRLRHTLLTVEDDPSTVADAVELRDHLEAFVDVAAARSRTDADVVDLRDQLDRMSAAADWPGFLHENWALHERIAAIGSNRVAAAVYTSTLGQLHASSARLEPVPAGYRAERRAVHVDLVDAIAAGDEAWVLAVVVRHNATS